MQRKASPETIAAIRAHRAGSTQDKTLTFLGTTLSTFIRVVDGLPVQGAVLDRIEARLAGLDVAPPPPSMVGLRQGKLTVIAEAERLGASLAVMVRCDCGVERPMRVASLQGGAKSCGCYREPTVLKACVSVEHGRMLYEAFGRKQTIDAWSTETGIPVRTLRSRVHQYGRTMQEALTMAKVRRGRFDGGRTNERKAS